MSRILVIEDSALFAHLVVKEIEAKLGMTVVLAKSYAETQKLLTDIEEQDFFSEDYFSIAVSDLNLPDAPSGKVVDLVRSKNIPVIVFTSEFDNKMREMIWSKDIIDYVLKRGKQDVQYLVTLIKRIFSNRFIKVLVVDDSKAFRTQTCNLLEIHKYNLLQAGDGVEALKILKENPDINLVIADYEMPNMDGFVLTQKIREKYNKNEIAIIGVSSQGEHSLSAQFIKNGANDFICKPFLTEEFYCRVTQNVETIEHIKQLKHIEDELIQSRAKAVQASKDKSDILSNMSQKIGDPLKAIAELINLTMKTELSEKQSYYLNKISSSADSLSGIINDILAFSKSEAGK
jgi:PleD family two-component response regulator